MAKDSLGGPGALWRRTAPSRRAVLATVVLAGCGAAASSAKRAAGRSSAPPAPATTAPPTAAPTTAAPTTATPTTAAPTTPAPLWTPGPPAVEVVAGSRDRKQVALTFHGNGEPAVAEALLQIADQRRARITVFAVGSWLALHPDLGARMLRAGHELANHTFTHPELATYGEAAVEDEFARARDVLLRVSGTTGRWARPSAMDRSTPLVRAAAGRVGYPTVVAFDVDPADYQDPGAAAVVTRTLAAVRPGSIVSLHLGHTGTVQALPGILDGLAARGLAPVTVSTLLG